MTEIDEHDEECTCTQPTPIAPVSRFGTLKLSSVLKLSSDQNKKRLISDIEYLNQPQYEFLEQHTQQRFYSFLQGYWAKKAIAAGLTTKTEKGEVLTINPASIRVIDKRWKGASHCICGKAIRYEYWIQKYGPIGSVHILEHTGLDKELVRDITKGYKQQNTLRTEIVDILVEIKDNNDSIENWYTKFKLEDKKVCFSLINSEYRVLAEKLIELKLPFDKSLRDRINVAYQKYQYQKNVSKWSTASTPSVVSAVFPPTANCYQELIDRGENVLTIIRLDPNAQKANGFRIATLTDLQRILRLGTPTKAQVDYAKSLCEQLEHTKTPADTTPDFQSLAKQVLAEALKSNPNDIFAKNLYNYSMARPLTRKQLETVFVRSGDRPCLYDRYASVLSGIQKPILPPLDNSKSFEFPNEDPKPFLVPIDIPSEKPNPFESLFNAPPLAP